MGRNPAPRAVDARPMPGISTSTSSTMPPRNNQGEALPVFAGTWNHEPAAPPIASDSAWRTEEELRWRLPVNDDLRRNGDRGRIHHHQPDQQQHATHSTPVVEIGELGRNPPP